MPDAKNIPALRQRLCPNPDFRALAKYTVFIVFPIKAKMFQPAHCRLPAFSKTIIFQRTLPRLVSVALALRVRRRRRFMAAPVVQHLRHMHKLSACRIRPQHQIVILRPVKSAAQL